MYNTPIEQVGDANRLTLVEPTYSIGALSLFGCSENAQDVKRRRERRPDDIRSLAGGSVAQQALQPWDSLRAASDATTLARPFEPRKFIE